MFDLRESPVSSLLFPEIEELVKTRQFGALRDALSELTPPDVADLLRAMEPDDRAVAFRVLNKAMAADVFEYLPADEQEEMLRRLGQAEVAAILNEMVPDDRTALLEELPGAVTQRLITVLSPEERAVAQKLLGYPEESIGRLMTPDYVAIREDWTVEQVFEHLRRFGRDKETISILYVVDANWKLLDDIMLRSFVLAEPQTRVSDLMDEQTVRLLATDDQETAIAYFEKYDRSALPVVDSDEILVGIVTFDDVMDIAKEEVTEDIQKMGAVEALDEPYMSASLLTLVRKRGVWLSMLFLGEMFTASAMAYFEHEIERVVFLASFIPLIVSSGGNTGSQAATLVVRAMALGEIRLIDWWRVAYRELASGLMLGGWLGLLGIARIHVWHLAGWKDYTAHYHLVALSVGVAVCGVVIWGTMIGGLLPFLLRRIGLDPAAISAPFVATLVDVIGIVTYFTAVTMFLTGTLL